MGVPGLWDILQEAGHSRAVLSLAVVDGFENNGSGLRGLRVGIDASLWYFHAENSTDAGSNPELRLLAFRCFKLLSDGLIPLFVFDGPERPNVKRGNRMGKKGTHWLNRDFTNLLDCFGIEWRKARGEAEAELAYLNKIGVIDAVITDDVDALLFGARTVIRNMSFNLTGNKKNPAEDSQGKKSKYHVRVFEADAIESHRNVGLTRGGMILFALLSGGDYDNNKGVRNLSNHFAHGLARLGFGDRLLAEYGHGLDRLRAYLPQWRNEITQEIRTNASGFLPGRKDITLPNSFPDLTIFQLYVNPVTSARTSMNGTEGLAMRDPNPSLPRLAELCEVKFDDWGFRKGILKRFSNLLWPGVVLHLLRRAALEADEKERAKRSARGESLKITAPLQPSPAEAIGIPASLVNRYLNPAREDRAASAFVNRSLPAAPSIPADNPHPLLTQVILKKEAISADFVPRYRVAIDPTQLVELASSGFKSDDSTAASQPPTSQNSAPAGSQTLAIRAANFNPAEPIRIWVPASILRQVHPQLILDWESGKSRPAGARGNGKGKKHAIGEDADEDDQDESDEEDQDDEVLDLTKSPAKRSSSQRVRKAATASPSKRPVPTTATPAAAAAITPSVTLVKPVPKMEGSHQKPIVQPNAARGDTVVKQERVPGGQPGHPAPRAPQPPLSPHHAMLPPPPPFPPPPREYFNVGLIEAEEPLSDRAFIFTFTDPDDPAFVFIDGAEGSEQDDIDAGSVVEPIPLFNTQLQETHQSPPPAIQPPHQADSLPTSPRKAPTKRQGKQKQTQPPDIHVRDPSAGSSRLVLPIPSSSTACPAPPTPSQPYTPTRQRPAAPQPSTSRASDPHAACGPGEPAGLSKYDHLFDQVLGIAPGAQRRKPMTAAARKRMLAAIEAGSAQEPSESQPAKKRRTNPPATTSTTIQPTPSGSAPSARSGAVPQTPRRPAVTMSASQPSGGVRPLAQFPDLPPLGTSASQPSQSTPRVRAVNRLPDVVVVSSDEEDGSGSAVPTPSSRSTSTTRRPKPTASSSTTSHPSSRPGDDEFFAGTDRVIRLF